jgi:hypothetical protein
MKRFPIASMMLLCVTVLIPQVVVGEDPNAVPPPEDPPPGRLFNSVLPQAKGDLASGRISRKEMLAAWKKIDFEDVVESERAEGRQFLRILERMVAEDEKRAKNPPKPFEKMTRREKTAELIEQLRDQRGQFSGWFWRDRVCDTANSPAKLLSELGEEAVPQLIDSLHNDRFTRTSIGGENDPELLRIGDCALLILERIAVREFGNVGLVSRGYAAANQKAAIAWWRERSQIDERVYLIEGTRTGDWYSPRQAERLLERYPQSARSAIEAGIGNARVPSIKANLLRLAREIPGHDLIPIFRDALGRSTPAIRLQGAKGLLERGIPDGIEVVIKDWPPPRRIKEEWADRLEEAELIEFLIGCDSVAAIANLEANLHAIPYDSKASLLFQLGCWGPGGATLVYDHTHTTWRQLVRGFRQPRRMTDGRPVSLAVQEAINRLLVTILLTSDKQLDHVEDASTRSIHDEAARSLAENWGQRTLFDLNADQDTRKKQIERLKDMCRKKQARAVLGWK